MPPLAEHPTAPSFKKAHDALRSNQHFDCVITFWCGTSGHAYVHTIYTLTGCPAIPPASALLVRNLGHGSREVLDVICLDCTVPSLNLAKVRQRGAQLGANEVHLHFATGNRQAQQTAFFDLKTRHGAITVVGE